jgi:hypothetical protein
MENAPSRETGVKGEGPWPEITYTVDLTLPEWMIEKLTARALEQKVDPRTLILQAIGDYLTTH